MIGSPQDHVDSVMLDELKEVMEDDFGILIDTFLSDSEIRLVDVKTAYDELNSKKLRESAHSLKGSCSNVGAAKLADICKHVEELGRVNKAEDAGQLIKDILSEFEVVRVILKEQV
ncbi:MAG: histidine kinase [Moraxellaceae bacterium]|nr:MAG: histidine kinase [Moraxellaceae bacterium]